MSQPDPKAHSQPSERSHQFQRSLLEAFKTAEQVNYPANATIFQQDDPAQGIHLIHEGEVLLFINSGERRTPIHTVGAGSLLGLSAAVTGQACACTAETVQAVRAGFISRERLLQIVRHDSEYCFEVVKMLAAELLDLSAGALTAAHSHPKSIKHGQSE